MKPLTILAWILLLASPARADLSDSGHLSIGGNATIQDSMTIVGSSFSVGGSIFSIAEGTATFGGLIQAASEGIQWSDGSTSTTASSSADGLTEVVCASGSYTSPKTFTQPIFSLAYATATLTPSGNPVFVAVSVPARNGTTGYGVYASILKNGSNVGADNTEGVTMVNTALAGNQNNLSFSYWDFSPGSVEVSYALTMRVFGVSTGVIDESSDAQQGGIWACTWK